MFVLLTTEPGKILPTVASRCMHFTFRRIPPDLIAERLAQICEAEQHRAPGRGCWPPSLTGRTAGCGTR